MYKILLVGSGHMGSALLKSWSKNRIKGITVIDPKKNIKINKLKGIKFYKSISNLPRKNNFDLIFFAVRPNIINEIINNYNNIVNKKNLVITIIAGKKINYFENKLGKKISIVRAMPNLPVMVGKGVTGLFKNKNVNKIQKKFSEKLFKSVGKIYWLKNENLIDKITSLSGSGPAYFYYLIESLERAGIKIGLDKNFSYALAKETAIGSIKLLEISDDYAGQLRKNIAVKGGTTEAAIKIFEKNQNMNKIIFNAINSAYKKAKYLGKKNKK